MTFLVNLVHLLALFIQEEICTMTNRFYKLVKEAKDEAMQTKSKTINNKEAVKVKFNQLVEKGITNFSQPHAADMLGISLSGLKRIYYDDCNKSSPGKKKRWPYQSLTMIQRKACFLKYIESVCDYSSKVKDIDEKTITAEDQEKINQAFETSFKNRRF